MKHKISKTAFGGNINKPKSYANPKEINGQTFFLHFSPLLKIDSDKITFFKGKYVLIIIKYGICQKFIIFLNKNFLKKKIQSLSL